MNAGSEASSAGTTITFLRKKARSNLRKRRASNDDSDKDDDDGVNKAKLEETMELQRLRQRSAGVSAITLATGQKISKVEDIVATDSDPFKLNTGGLLDLSNAKIARAMMDDTVGTEAVRQSDFGSSSSATVGTQFSKETHVRDEDEEMKKFIELEMEKRKRKNDAEGGDSYGSNLSYLTPEDRALKALPAHLKKSTFRKNEEMLSSQMLSGIPEVDLGIEEKIRNIEATEDAKRKMATVNTKANKPSEFVPTNLAVNFKQPNRFRTDIEQDSVSRIGSAPTLTERTVVVGDVPLERVVSLSAEAAPVVDASRATDDLHLTKFKQHFHRK